jgi:tRNA nucleotidyltransferase (CCA-adding enzyme)
MKKGNMRSSTLLETVSPSTLKLLVWLSEQAAKQKVCIYVVGGFVRDLILKRPTNDFDIVIEGDAIELAKSLARTIGGRLVIHSAFGTAVWNINSIHEKLQTELGLNELNETVEFPKHVDFITAREESYLHPAALPVVKPGSIESDLRRRDFTINTLAINLSQQHFGELLDPFDGFKDIQNGSVRVLHDKSFVDDPTRQLRAVRFEQRFGFRIKDHTLELMRDARSYLGIITGIRVRHELDLMLKEDHFEKLLARAQKLDILSAIHSSLQWNDNLAKAFQKLSTLNWDSEWGIRPSFGRLGFKTGLKYAIWLALFPSHDQKALVQRLSIPQAIANIARKAHALSEILPGLGGKSNSEIVFQLDKFPAIVNLACYLMAYDDWTANTSKKYIYKWRKIVPYTNGHILRDLGLPSGSAYKTILQTLKAAWLDDKIHTKEEEQALLKILLKEKGDFLKN